MSIGIDSETAAVQDVNLDDVKDSEIVKVVKSLVSIYTPSENKESEVTMKIILKDEEPLYQHPRRMSAQESTVIESQIEDWLRIGVVRHSSSDFVKSIS